MYLPLGRTPHTQPPKHLIASPMSSAPVRSPHRKLRIALIVLAVMIALLFGAYEWLISKAQTTLRERLAQRGLNLTYSSEFWTPWGGITLKDAALRRLTPANEPLIEISALHVEILWREAWHARAVITHWYIDDAILTLHDQEGPVALQHFSADFAIRDDKIELARLDAANGPVTFAVKGEIITAAAKDAPAQKDPAFQMNLKPLRSVLDTLDFKPGTGPFTITGSFAVDLRQTAVMWSATLHGAGKKVEWRGVPMQQAEMDAQLSQAELKLSAQLGFVQGSATLEATRTGWEQEPLMMAGTLTDSAGRKDEFKGRHEGKAETLTVNKISGSANLLELAHNIPALGDGLPHEVKVTTFPDIVAENFVWHTHTHPTTWTLASLQLRKPAALIVTVRDHPLTIDHLLGGLSYDHHIWHFDDLNGQLLGGQFMLKASYDGKTLNKANLAFKSLHLAQLTPWVGKLSARLEDAEMSLLYQGVISNDPTQSTGSGMFDMVHAPVIHVPLLDQAYQLFPKILSREHPNDTGEVKAKFTMTHGLATVEPMKVIGQSVVVTARGTVDLNKRVVEGHARANVRGVVGVIISPISLAFLEMKVVGPLDDIKVSPLGPLGAAKTVIGGAAKLSSTVLREGVSVPFEALGMFRKENSKAAE